MKYYFIDSYFLCITDNGVPGFLYFTCSSILCETWRKIQTASSGV